MKKKKILIVVSKYNKLIGNGLQEAAMDKLSSYRDFEKYIIETSGAFEIPSIIEKYIKKYDGVVALGCIIKGETINFELISQSITDALMQLTIKHKKPIGNGIITCLNDEQAKMRRKKGAEAASAVIDVIKFSSPTKFS